MLTSRLVDAKSFHIFRWRNQTLRNYIEHIVTEITLRPHIKFNILGIAYYAKGNVE